MSQNDVPKQVRVRTDDGNEYRYDAIMKAADRFECNKTRAIVLSCDAVGSLLENVEEALQHPDLPPSVAAELAETISTPKLEVEYDQPSVEIDDRKS